MRVRREGGVEVLVHDAAVTSRGVRILVVDDDDSVRDAIEIAFRAEGFDVSGEAEGTHIEKVVEKFRPDLAILDVRVGTGPDGLAMARQLRKVGDLPILLLTAADSLDDRLAGFRAGADDYVVKPFSMAEVLARAEALLRRSGRLSASSYQLGDIAVDDGTRTVARDGNDIELTRTEYDLLAALCRNPGQVLSKQQLLQQVWGFDAYDDNVVEVHMSALRRKLEAHGPRVIQTVRSIGYILRA